MMPNNQQENEKLFRILSLDGGGVRGILQARTLANIEKYLNNRDGKDVPIGKRFDLIAGTSTGGIIALGLSMGRPATDILSFYEKYIPTIFGNSNKTGLLRKPKYSPAPLESALVDFFGDDTLEDVITDTCIPAVALQNAKPRLHKSGYMLRNQERLSERLVDIALATSAAPTFFPAHSMSQSTNLIDGGICANNPAMVALVESMQFEITSNRGVKPPAKGTKRLLENIMMLSLGTGEQCAMPYAQENLKSAGVMNWSFCLDRSYKMLEFKPVIPIVELMMQSQSTLAHFQTMFMVGNNRYHRINPQLKFPMSLDDVNKIDELKNLSDITVEIEDFVNYYLT